MQWNPGDTFEAIDWDISNRQNNNEKCPLSDYSLLSHTHGVFLSIFARSETILQRELEI